MVLVGWDSLLVRLASIYARDLLVESDDHAVLNKDIGARGAPCLSDQVVGDTCLAQMTCIPLWFHVRYTMSTQRTHSIFSLRNGRPWNAVSNRLLGKPS